MSIRRPGYMDLPSREKTVVSRANAEFGFPVHPTPTAGSAPIGDEEPNWVSCKQCGWPVFIPDHPKGSGYGNKTFVDSGGNTNDEIVTAGCPNCASDNYY